MTDVDDLLVARGGRASVEEIQSDAQSKGILRKTVENYIKENPSRQQGVVKTPKKIRIFYTRDFELKHQEQMISHRIAGTTCYKEQDVIPEICHDYCEQFSRCYGPEGNLRLILQGRGITLEPQSRQDSQNSSLGSILRQARIRARHTRPDSSAAPYSGRE